MMAPLVMFWVGSALAGALLFAAGRFAGLRRALAAHDEIDGTLQRLRGELASVAPLRDEQAQWRAARLALERERDELAGRCAALERARDEQARARAALERKRDELGAEAEKLRAAAAENATLRRRLAELEAPSEPPRAAAVAPAPLPPRAGSSEQTYQQLLGRIGATRGLRSAVLADPMGLPIAGLGELAEPLAGYGGFLVNAASKARDFLPLKSVRRIVIEDDARTVLTACPLEGTEILIATLTTGPGPDLVRMTQILTAAASVMQ